MGFIKIVHTERIQDGVERMNFSVGIPALDEIQKSDELLWRLSEVLNAPREKLVKTVERLLREWKKARREKKRLVKEIAAGRKGVMPGVKREVKEIGEVRFVSQEFERLDVDRMIETASEVTTASPNTIVVFSGTDEKTARIIVMAGKDALKHGVNARKVAEEIGRMLGGGGSGRPDFAQAGGTKVKVTSEALQRAEKVVWKQLGEKTS